MPSSVCPLQSLSILSHISTPLFVGVHDTQTPPSSIYPSQLLSNPSHTSCANWSQLIVNVPPTTVDGITIPNSSPISQKEKFTGVLAPGTLPALHRILASILSPS